MSKQMTGASDPTREIRILLACALPMTGYARDDVTLFGMVDTGIT